MKIKKILFVCTENICRSPMAETILKEKLKNSGMTDISVMPLFLSFSFRIVSAIGLLHIFAVQTKRIFFIFILKKLFCHKGHKEKIKSFCFFKDLFLSFSVFSATSVAKFISPL